MRIALWCHRFFGGLPSAKELTGITTSSSAFVMTKLPRLCGSTPKNPRPYTPHPHPNLRYPETQGAVTTESHFRPNGQMAGKTFPPAIAAIPPVRPLCDGLCPRDPLW